MSISAAIIDTCVVVDMFLESRARHAQALELLEAIRERKVHLRMPAFGLFELSHAVRQEKSHNGATTSASELVGPKNGLHLELVSIDQSFIEKYLDPSLPEVRAGDLVFLALAKGDGLPLITEDQLLRRQASAAGLQVLSESELLQLLQESAT